MNSGVLEHVSVDQDDAQDQFSEISWRLDALERRIDWITGTADLPVAVEREPEAAVRIADAIARLDRRIEQFMVKDRSTFPEMERRIDAIDNSAGQVDRAKSRSTVPTSPLDQALLEIAERQRALANELPSGDLPRAPNQEIGGLEQQLRSITEKVETLRPCGIDGAVQALRDDLTEFGVMLKDALPRQVVESLETGVRQLVERIDAQRHITIDSTAFASIERGLAEVSKVVRALAPMESRAGNEGLVKQPSQKVRDIEASTQNPIAFEQLEEAIVALRTIVGRVASNDTLAALRDEVRNLAGRIEQTPAAGMIANLEQRIATLADALQARNQAIEDTHSIAAGQRSRPAAQDQFPALSPQTMDPQLSAAAFTQPAQSRASNHAQQSDPPKPNQDSATRNSASGNSVARAERLPIDPSLPPDHPLEPNSRSRSSASPVERIAMSKLALAGVKAAAESEADGKVDYIAAARRAARAAASIDAASERHTTRTVEPARASPRRTKGPSKRLRSTILAAGIAVAVLSSLHMIWNLVRATHGDDESALATAARSILDQTDADGTSAPNKQGYNPPVPAEARPPATDGRSNLLPSSLLAAPGAGILLPANLGRAAPGTVPNPATGTSPDIEATGSVPAPSLHAPPVHAPGPSGQSQGPAPMNQTLEQMVAESPPSARIAGPEKLPPTIGSETLRAAAANGDAAAEFEIASRFAEGRGVPRNLAAAADWFERAAKQGLAPAQLRLGSLYEKGLGVKKSIETARRHYLMAAAAGNAKAMHNLAVLYAEGTDGKPDYTDAARWFRKAADFGVTDSQFNLAILYSRGIGVEGNLGEAYKWFAIAAQAGDVGAGKRRDELAGRLDRSTMVAARKAAQAWSAQRQIEAATNVQSPPAGWDGGTATPQAGKPHKGSKNEIPRAARQQ